jgi:hypothetical protein
MLPATAKRVVAHTPQKYTQRIRRQTEENIAFYQVAGPAAIDRRLEELDHEWDIERLLEANAASLSLVGLALGSFVDRRYYALPAVVAGFLLQHALQGWCPPVPVFRRLGVRTMGEIDEERFALKAIHGDFSHISGNGGSRLQEAEHHAAR